MLERLPEDKARARLEAMVSGLPALPVQDIDLLMTQARLEEPDDEELLPGFDLSAAAAEGWRWRAGRLADQRQVGAEGAQVANQQRFEHALQMVSLYASGAGSSGVTQTTFRRTDVIG